VHRNLGPGGQCRQLAISRRHPPRAAHTAPHPLPQRGVERVVSSLAGLDIAGEQMARRLGGSGHLLPLRQVRTVILAGPPLPHPPLGQLGRARARRAVQAYASQCALVHRARRRPQLTRNGRPRLVITQAMPYAAQPIVATCPVADRLPQHLCQRVGHAVRPVAHRRCAVIGPRQDVRQPPHGQLAVVQPLLQAVCPRMPVEPLSQPQLRGQAKNQRNIIHAFMSENEYLCHGAQPIAAFTIGLASLRESTVMR
jgi:hypothetical protein